MYQFELEAKFHRDVVIINIKEEMAEYFREIKTPADIIPFLCNLYVHQEMELTHVLGYWHKSRGGETPFPWDEVEPYAVLLPAERMLRSRFLMKQEHQAALEATFSSALPMVEPPLLVTDNSSNGRYLNSNHVICGNPLARHDGELCLDVVNMLNQQQWKLNLPLKGTSKNLMTEPALDNRRKAIVDNHGSAPAWFPWSCDMRGRLYARNHYFNPQGDDAGKASISLWCKREVVTREGEFALWADLGSMLGFDKKSWFERTVIARRAFKHGIDWTLANHKPEGLNLLKSCWLACEQFVKGEAIDHMVSLDATSSGLQIAAALVADGVSLTSTNAIPNGKRNDAYTSTHEAFVSMFPEIGQKFDRSSLKKALMTMAYGSTKVPKDVFGDEVSKFLTCVNKELPGPMYVNRVLQGLFDYTKETHEWDMPDGFHVRIVSHTSVEHSRTVPEVGTVYYQTDEIVPGEKDKGMAANTIHSLDAFILREVVRLCNYDDAFLNQVHAVLNSKSYSDAPVSEQTWNLVDCWRRTGIPSYRIFAAMVDEPGLMSLLNKGEAFTLRQMWNKCEGRKIQLMTIHDCFRCHPDDAWIVRKYYSMILANVCRGNFLQHMVSSLTQGNLKIVEVGQETRKKLAEQIEKSVYAIC